VINIGLQETDYTSILSTS